MPQTRMSKQAILEKEALKTRKIASVAHRKK
jgi:hypothetical protein